MANNRHLGCEAMPVNVAYRLIERVLKRLRYRKLSRAAPVPRGVDTQALHSSVPTVRYRRRYLRDATWVVRIIPRRQPRRRMARSSEEPPRR
jgi:hypothetical protein